MTTAAVDTPTLIGVGVGPGDPELVTLKAARVIADADIVLVPSTEASGDDAGRAERVVLAACPTAAGKLRRVPFSMVERSGVGVRRRQSWKASATAVVQAFQAGATVVAFATVGDPSVYSTFSYLTAQVRTEMPDIAVSVVPGITAMQALAAASLTPLVEGRETLALVPATAGMDAVGAALSGADTVVAYKGGRQLADLLALVRGLGRDGVLGVNVGLTGQTITPLSEVALDQAPYFSTVLVTPHRTRPGGQL